MRFQTIPLLLLLIFAILCSSVRAKELGIDIEAAVTRYSELELTEHQTAILDEATKLSAASRVFYGLFNRWPKDIQELSDRTTGIDFTVFDGKISIDATTDGLVITVFDSKDVRKLLATESSPLSELKELAESPDFKIRVSLRREPSDGA
ncbi:hypothetical protein [Luteimonas sp. A649]